jgi:hypothetical protein
VRDAVRAFASRAIAQVDERRRVDAVEQLARLLACQHRGLACLDHVLRPAHGMRRIGRDHLAGDEPVEQHADRGEVLLDGRRAVAATENLDIGGDVVGAPCRERRDALGVEPGEERAHGDGVGGAGVGVANVGGEEIEKAQARVLTGIGDQPGSWIADTAAGKTISLDSMTASAWPGSAGLSSGPTVDLPMASASTGSSISMLIRPRVSLFRLPGPLLACPSR